MNIKDRPFYEKMKTEYLEGKVSLTFLSHKYFLDRSSLSNCFKKDGIEIINKQNMLKFDNTVFDKINTEEKAYWLGFIYADGYISSRDNTFEVSLALKDIDHLQKLADFMNHSDNVKSDSYRCRFMVCNKHLHKQLNKLGCIPQKSLILKFPPRRIVPRRLLHHFIRGYFDGDGHVSSGFREGGININKKFYMVQLLGTNHFLSGVLESIKLESNIRMAHKDSSPLSKAFSFAKEKGLRFLEYMYLDSTIHLNRKYNKYKEFAALARNG